MPKTQIGHRNSGDTNFNTLRPKGIIRFGFFFPSPFFSIFLLFFLVGGGGGEGGGGGGWAPLDPPLLVADQNALLMKDQEDREPRPI